MPITELNKDKTSISRNNRAFRTKYQVISDDLRKQIARGDYVAGQKLPSQQRLMEQYTASLSTIRQSIMELGNDGLVRSEHGRGVFVLNPAQADGSQAAAPLIETKRAGFAIFAYPNDDSAYVCILNAFSHELRSAGWDVSYAVFRPDDPLVYDKYADYVQNLKVITIVGSIRPVELLKYADSQTRMIVVGHTLDDEGLDQVNQISVDAFSAGYYAAKMLLIRGHKRLAIINQTGTRYVTEVENGVDTACHDVHVPLPWRDSIASMNFQQEIQSVEYAVRQESATGIVVVDDIRACRIISWMSQNGIAVPSDVSVSVVGGLPQHTLTIGNLSRVNIGYNRIGEALAQMVLSPSACLIHKILPVRTESGGTTAQPPRE